jgi:DNA-binding NarL/FixJ family response regulator
VVSLSTVRTQIRAILGKLQVNSQIEAAAMVRQTPWS